MFYGDWDVANAEARLGEFKGCENCPRFIVELLDYGKPG